MGTNGFQSTLPAWGVTVDLKTTAQAHKNFNPHSPHGE